MKFKDRLVFLRKNAGLTQKDFAEKIGYTRTAISAWEIGRNEPSSADMIKIAEFFCVSVDYLLGKTDIPNSSPDMQNDFKQLKQEFEFAYHKEMEGLTEEEITDALRFYKEMKNRVKKDK